MTRAASFDVFDTMLTRLVGHPTAAFLLLGRRLNHRRLIRLTPESFARARVAAEQRAYASFGSSATLSQVYQELGSFFGWTPAEQQRLIAEELGLEEELLRGVPESLARVERDRSAGRRVVFVSDMYLPAAFIQRQLERRGIWRAGDVCYVSCEHGHTKSNGLFGRLLAQEGLNAADVHHCGNHARDDVRAARRAGLSAEHVTACNPNRFEKILESHAFATEGLSSVMAGASRLARLTVPAASEKARALRDTAAGVVAPTLIGFVLWVLRRAEALGLARLYFVSRDGQILHEIARRLAPRLGARVELRYLYGSRQAWHLPSIQTIGERELTWILSKSSFLSVRIALARVCVDPEAIAERLEACGLPRGCWNAHVTPAQYAALRRLLLEDAGVRDLIVRQAAERREVLLAYLRQEGVHDPLPMALVDLGWSGKIQKSLALAGGVRMRGFYFGLHEGSVSSQDGVRECYFFDRRQGLGFGEDVGDLPCILEAFCAADHGLVLGYARTAEQVRPVLQEPATRPLIEWGLPVVRRSVEAFVDHLMLDLTLVNPDADLRPAVADLLQAFWDRPTNAEALAYGDFPYEDDQTGAYWAPLASPYGLLDVLRAFRTGKLPSPHAWTWHRGCLLFTPPPVRFLIKVATRLGRLWRIIWRRVAGSHGTASATGAQTRLPKPPRGVRHVDPAGVRDRVRE